MHSENKGKQTKKKLCSENNKSVAANDTAPSAISINVIRNRCTWVWARNSTFFCSCSRNLFFVHKQTLKRLTYNLISAFLCSSAATHWCLATHTHILDAFMLRLSAVAVHKERKKKAVEFIARNRSTLIAMSDRCMNRLCTHQIYPIYWKSCTLKSQLIRFYGFDTNFD